MQFCLSEKQKLFRKTLILTFWKCWISAGTRRSTTIWVVPLDSAHPTLPRKSSLITAELGTLILTCGVIQLKLVRHLWMLRRFLHGVTICGLPPT